MGQLLTLKTLLTSAGVLFMALGLRFSVPKVMEFLESHIPLMWELIRTCLSPPYLYLMVNFIVLSIVASYKFHKDNEQYSIDNLQTKTFPPLHDNEEKDADSYGLNLPLMFAVQVQSELLAIKYQHNDTGEEEDNALEPELVKHVISEDDNEPDMAEARPEYIFPAEKHMVSARFGHQKPMKIRRDRRARRWGSPKQHDTMENTWRAIMQNKARSLSSHMTEHDTWNNHVTLAPLERLAVNDESENFNDRTNQAEWSPSLSPISRKMRKEPWVSKDELNRRADEFITKINEDMRLQRKESLEQYMKMVGRGKRLTSHI